MISGCWQRNARSRGVLRLALAAAWALSGLARLASAAEDLPAAPAASDQHAAPAEIVFHRDIEPILRRNCYRCHSAAEQRGDLRLDNRAAALRGGHTGQMLLGDPQSSALFARITSDDPALAMPKEGQPLTKAEIASIEAWLRSGADWPERSATVPATGAYAFWKRVDPVLRAMERYRTERLPQTLVGFALLAGLLWTGYARSVCRRTAREGRQASWLVRRGAALPRSLFLAGAVGLAGWEAAAYQREENARLSEELAAARQRAEEVRRRLNPQPQEFYGYPPVPLRPHHPPRLSGEYYRGNDERSPALFNGGNYRTATLRAALCGGDRQPLVAGQAAIPPLWLHLEIERARQASPTLFSEAIMSGISLTASQPRNPSPTPGAPPRLKFPPEEQAALVEKVPGELWEAWYAIPAGDGRLPPALCGLVYVYSGRSPESQSEGSINYGIQYELRFEDGRVAEGSEVWMGSLWVAPASIQFPLPERISLEEWFSDSPIPEIVGDPSSDPKLLGIEEHQQSGLLPAPSDAGEKAGSEP